MLCSSRGRRRHVSDERRLVVLADPIFRIMDGSHRRGGQRCIGIKRVAAVSGVLFIVWCLLFRYSLSSCAYPYASLSCVYSCIYSCPPPLSILVASSSSCVIFHQSSAPKKLRSLSSPPPSLERFEPPADARRLLPLAELLLLRRPSLLLLWRSLDRARFVLLLPPS